MSVVVRLERARIDPREELDALLDQSAGDGAVVSFVGVARAAGKGGNLLQKLVLEDHPVLTPQSLHDIAIAASQRFDVNHVRVIHRCGAIIPGESIVFAGAASAHRRPAFEAADYLMDRLKTEAVLWKREVSAAGSAWIEPTDADRADRKRWS